MKNSFSAKRKISLTIIAMLVTVLSLLSSTYAWYTMSTNTGTGLLELSVESSMTLTMSTNEAGEYKYTLATSDIQQYLNKLTLKGDSIRVLSPVSTVDCGKFFAPIINDGQPMVSHFTPVTAENGMYLELPVYLKSTKNVKVYLDRETSVAVRDSSIASEEGQVDRVVRIGFITADGSIIFEPSAVKSMFGRRSNSQGQLGEYYAVEKDDPLTYGFQRTYSAEDMLVTFNGAIGMEADNTNTDAVSKKEIATLTANVPKNVIIYLWIEGTDWDCINELLEGTLNVNLKFIGVQN